MGPPHGLHPSLNMTEEMRGRMLGRAKKKLQEYQQKNCPAGIQGARKAKKNPTVRNPKTSPGDPKSQEQVPKDHLEPEGPPVLPAGTPTSVPSADTRIKKMPLIQKDLTDYGMNLTTVAMTWSSTKSQDQLPPGLQALQAESTSPEMVKDLTSASHTEDLDKPYKDLATALDACSIQNQQLRSEMENLKHQKEELQYQLQTQIKQHQKMVSMQETLENDLKCCKQSMQNLLSENSDLHSALAHMQQVAKERELEHQVLVSRLQASEELIKELELTVVHLRETSQPAQDQREKEEDPQDLMLSHGSEAPKCQDKKLAAAERPVTEPSLDLAQPVAIDIQEELGEGRRCPHSVEAILQPWGDLILDTLSAREILKVLPEVVQHQRPALNCCFPSQNEAYELLEVVIVV
ncbi:golgin subfamily A member 2-like [Dipodomys merriami]|uniref:golgin subfamily A member 2-like n=1 Tax=Dipodomys merriami TaxID=94247 RepID=UPI003855A9AA